MAEIRGVVTPALNRPPRGRWRPASPLVSDTVIVPSAWTLTPPVDVTNSPVNGRLRHSINWCRRRSQTFDAWQFARLQHSRTWDQHRRLRTPAIYDFAMLLGWLTVLARSALSALDHGVGEAVEEPEHPCSNVHGA